MQSCSTGLLQLTKLNRERGLASAWLEHTVQRHLPKQTAKGYVQIFPSQTSVGGGCFNAPRQQWYQDTLAAQLTSRDWWRALFPCKSWDNQFKRNVKGKYYVSTQDESNSAGSHFFLKAQEYGGRRGGRWMKGQYISSKYRASFHRTMCSDSHWFPFHRRILKGRQSLLRHWKANTKP